MRAVFRFECRRVLFLLRFHRQSTIPNLKAEPASFRTSLFRFSCDMCWYDRRCSLDTKKNLMRYSDKEPGFACKQFYKSGRPHWWGDTEDDTAKGLIWIIQMRTGPICITDCKSTELEGLHKCGAFVFVLVGRPHFFSLFSPPLQPVIYFVDWQNWRSTPSSAVESRSLGSISLREIPIFFHPPDSLKDRFRSTPTREYSEKNPVKPSNSFDRWSWRCHPIINRRHARWIPLLSVEISFFCHSRV